MGSSPKRRRQAAGRSPQAGLPRCPRSHPIGKPRQVLPTAWPAPAPAAARSSGSLMSAFKRKEEDKRPLSCGTTSSSAGHPSLPLYFIPGAGESSTLPPWAGELCPSKRPGGVQGPQGLGTTHLCSAGGSAFALRPSLVLFPRPASSRLGNYL